MLKMRDSGLTYREIGERLGCSKQYVNKVLQEQEYRKYSGWVYPNARAWMLENGIFVSRLAKELGVTDKTLERAMQGGNTTKYVIDQLLAATGMTYEQLFYRPEA